MAACQSLPQVPISSARRQAQRPPSSSTPKEARRSAGGARSDVRCRVGGFLRRVPRAARASRAYAGAADLGADEVAPVATVERAAVHVDDEVVPGTGADVVSAVPKEAQLARQMALSSEEEGFAMFAAVLDAGEAETTAR
jgi:hypothetical protein